MPNHRLKKLLDSRVEKYNQPEFIASDPIFIPHSFSRKEDIEISGFLTATMAWGKRSIIISNAKRLMALMDHAPFQFVEQHLPKDRLRFKGFVHRTFNYDDLNYFLSSLQNIYLNHGGLESVLGADELELNVKDALARFRAIFFELEHLPRTEKHLSNPYRNSSCKRLNMFLRWMVRNDNQGVDFGIWQSIKSSQLSCPLDVHSGRVARKLALLTRKQDDWKAVEELDTALRAMDPDDPAKYDFALFGLGVFEAYGL